MPNPLKTVALSRREPSASFLADNRANRKQMLIENSAHARQGSKSHIVRIGRASDVIRCAAAAGS